MADVRKLLSHLIWTRLHVRECDENVGVDSKGEEKGHPVGYGIA